MKKILLLLSIFLFSSCVRNFYIENVSLDYSQYTKQGFFITESPTAPFDYEPIASLYTFVYSGKDKEWAKNNKSNMRKDPFSEGYRMATYSDGIESIYQDAIKKGADGIININYNVTYNKEGGVDHIIVKGMAIKRK